MAKQKDNDRKLIKQNELSLLQNFCDLRSAQDQVLWSVFGAFWGTNALLLVSIFAADKDWKNLVIILIPLIGIIVSIIWLIIQSRTIARIEMYEDSIAKIEEKNNFLEHLRTFSKRPKEGIKARTVMNFSVKLVMGAWIIGFCISAMTKWLPFVLKN